MGQLHVNLSSGVTWVKERCGCRSVTAVSSIPHILHLGQAVYHVHVGMPCCPASIPLMLTNALPHHARPSAVFVKFVALQSLRKQLKRSAAQCEALKAEVAELKRRDRTADLYKKKVTREPSKLSQMCPASLPVAICSASIHGEK